LVREAAAAGSRRRGARPGLSLLGAVEAGQQVIALAANPDWTREAFARMTLPSPETRRALDTITDALSWFFAGMVAAVLLARIARRAWRRRHGVVRIGYPDGRFVEVTPGTSVLEASRIAGIPHASVCGGHGRCSSSGGGSMRRSRAAPTRQDEQRPWPPHTEACGIPAIRLASSTLVPGVTSTKRPSG